MGVPLASHNQRWRPFCRGSGKDLHLYRNRGSYSCCLLLVRFPLIQFNGLTARGRRKQLAPTVESNFSGTDNFFDAKWFKQVEDGVDLALIASDFNNERTWVNIDHLRTEKIHDIQDLVARPFVN